MLSRKTTTLGLPAISRLKPGADSLVIKSAELIVASLQGKSRAGAGAINVEYPRSIEIMTKLYRFLKNESGVTAIEYGLIAAGIGVAIVVIVQSVGTALVAVFTTVETNLS